MLKSMLYESDSKIVNAIRCAVLMSVVTASGWYWWQNYGSVSAQSDYMCPMIISGAYCHGAIHAYEKEREAGLNPDPKKYGLAPKEHFRIKWPW